MATGSMQLEEALAVARLRQWAALRVSCHYGKATNYERQGWRTRNSTRYDAALVTVIDFERALNALPDDEKLALVLRYRDRADDRDVARMLGCSTRKLGYLIPNARRMLAARLDKLNLL